MFRSRQLLVIASCKQFLHIMQQKMHRIHNKQEPAPMSQVQQRLDEDKEEDEGNIEVHQQ